MELLDVLEQRAYSVAYDPHNRKRNSGHAVRTQPRFTTLTFRRFTVHHTCRISIYLLRLWVPVRLTKLTCVARETARQSASTLGNLVQVAPPLLFVNKSRGFALTGETTFNVHPCLTCRCYFDVTSRGKCPESHDKQQLHPHDC